MTESSETLTITLLSTQEQLHGLIDAGEAALQLLDEGIIAWKNTPVARLQKGDALLKPQLASMATLDETQTQTLLNHVSAWLQRFIDKNLQGLLALQNAEGLTPPAQSVAQALAQHLGTTAREHVAPQVKVLTPEERAALRALGVRFGEYAVFVRDLLRPAAVRLKIMLKAIWLGENPHVSPPAGVAAVAITGDEPAWYWDVCGYRVCGGRAVRCDMIEKLADVVRPLTKRTDENPKGEFSVTPEMMSFIGRSGPEFAAVLQAMGYQSRTVESVAAEAPEVTEATETAEVTPTEAAEALPQTVSAEVAAQPATATKVLWVRKSLRVQRTQAPRSASAGSSGGRYTPRTPEGDAPAARRGANMPRFFQKRSDDGSAPQTPRSDSHAPRSAQRPDNRPARAVDPENPFAVLASFKTK